MSYRLPTHCPQRPVNIANNHPRAHNLNIQSYSLDEILGIFNLSYDISIDDLKRAKKQVLMVHPDKSQLPSDYFLFYKKAYEIILDFYTNNSRQHLEIPDETPKYQPVYSTDKYTTKHIQGSVRSMDEKAFHGEFNRLFDEHMARKPDETANQWFREDTPSYTYQGKVSAGNMSNAFVELKQQNQDRMLAHYRGVREMNSAGSRVSSALDDEMVADDVYITSDPFSKLKYEDLRKVHKEQTIFAVSENDFQRVQQYASVEQYSRSRDGVDMTPMEKSQAEAMLNTRQREQQEIMMKRQHEANLRMMENEEKNKLIRSRFLQLENKR